LAATIAAQLVVVFTVDVRPGLIVVDFHNAYYRPQSGFSTATARVAGWARTSRT
jgi:hypothetical protein